MIWVLYDHPLWYQESHAANSYRAVIILSFVSLMHRLSLLF